MSLALLLGYDSLGAQKEHSHPEKLPGTWAKGSLGGDQNGLISVFLGFLCPRILTKSPEREGVSR